MAKKKGTEVEVVKISLPANIAAEMEAAVKGQAAKTQAPTGDKVKLTKKKTFKLPDGTETEGPISAVILDFVATNTFHDRPYKDGEASAPACFAIGEDIAALVPSKSSPDVQSKACTGCPNNEFKSKGDGKACKNGRRMVIVPGVGDAAADPNATMWILDVSPTGLKAFDAYVKTVESQFNKPLCGVVTEIFFDPSSEYQSLRFGNPALNENVAVHWPRRAAAKKRLMTEPDVSGYKKPVAGKRK